MKTEFSGTNEFQETENIGLKRPWEQDGFSDISWDEDKVLVEFDAKVKKEAEGKLRIRFWGSEWNV